MKILALSGTLALCSIVDPWEVINDVISSIGGRRVSSRLEGEQGCGSSVVVVDVTNISLCGSREEINGPCCYGYSLLLLGIAADLICGDKNG